MYKYVSYPEIKGLYLFTAELPLSKPVVQIIVGANKYLLYKLMPFSSFQFF